jgi:prepilin-type N-terminal cleavage/methylation domain-containing protein
VRLRRDDGFTLIELLIVLLILAILLTIGIASFIGMRQRASDGAAKANLRAALPSVYAYSTDNGGFTGMTIAELERYDSGLGPITILSADDGAYCLSSTNNGRTWFGSGPPLSVSQSTCA